jgi:hypothetical protein
MLRKSSLRYYSAFTVFARHRLLANSQKSFRSQSPTKWFIVESISVESDSRGLDIMGNVTKKVVTLVVGLTARFSRFGQ